METYYLHGITWLCYFTRCYQNLGGGFLSMCYFQPNLGKVNPFWLINHQLENCWDFVPWLINDRIPTWQNHPLRGFKKHALAAVQISAGNIGQLLGWFLYSCWEEIQVMCDVKVHVFFFGWLFYLMLFDVICIYTCVYMIYIYIYVFVSNIVFILGVHFVFLWVLLFVLTTAMNSCLNTYNDFSRRFVHQRCRW